MKSPLQDKLLEEFSAYRDAGSNAMPSKTFAVEDEPEKGFEGFPGDVVDPAHGEFLDFMQELGLVPKGGFEENVREFKRYFNEDVAPRIGTKLRLPDTGEIDEITGMIIKRYLEGGGEELKPKFERVYGSMNEAAESAKKEIGYE